MVSDGCTVLKNTQRNVTLVSICLSIFVSLFGLVLSLIVMVPWDVDDYMYTIVNSLEIKVSIGFIMLFNFVLSVTSIIFYNKYIENNAIEVQESSDWLQVSYANIYDNIE